MEDKQESAGAARQLKRRVSAQMVTPPRPARLSIDRPHASSPRRNNGSLRRATSQQKSTYVACLSVFTLFEFCIGVDSANTPTKPRTPGPATRKRASLSGKLGTHIPYRDSVLT